MHGGATVVGCVLLSTSAATAAAQSREAPGSEARITQAPTTRDAAARDTIFNVASAVPPAGVVRASVGAGGDRSSAEGDLGGTFNAGLLWSIGAGVATEVTANARSSGGYPAVALRWQWLDQSRAGVDVMTAVRYGSFGTELPTISGGQIAAQLAIGRSFGPLLLTANGAIARGVVERTDVDAIAGAAALVDLVSTRWRIGVDARARSEVEDRYKTEEDEGRPVELVVGGVSAHRYGPVYIQVLAGWQAPRGAAEPGPVALASVSADF